MILNSLSNSHLDWTSIVIWITFEHMFILWSIGSHKLQTCRIEFHCTERIRDCGNFEREITLNRFHCWQLSHLILTFKSFNQLLLKGGPRKNKESTGCSKLVGVLQVIRIVIVYTNAWSFFTCGCLLSHWFNSLSVFVEISHYFIKWLSNVLERSLPVNIYHSASTELALSYLHWPEGAYPPQEYQNKYQSHQ